MSLDIGSNGVARNYAGIQLLLSFSINMIFFVCTCWCLLQYYLYIFKVKKKQEMYRSHIMSYWKPYSMTLCFLVISLSVVEED